jgi:hypothetical protein
LGNYENNASPFGFGIGVAVTHKFWEDESSKSMTAANAVNFICRHYPFHMRQNGLQPYLIKKRRLFSIRRAASAFSVSAFAVKISEA